MASLLAVVLCVCLAAPTYAKDGDAQEGIIVQLASGEMVIDLGSKQGLPSGAKVHIFRRLEVKHPVTGKPVVDRFLIGEVRVSELGALLSIVNSYSSLKRSPAVGDFVVYYPSSAPSTAQADTRQTPPATGPETIIVEKDCPEMPPPTADGSSDPELAAMEVAFNATLGKDFDRREQIWVAYLRQTPGSRYVGAITREVEWLREQQRVEQNAEPEASSVTSGSLTVRVAIPDLVPVDAPIELNASVLEQERIDRIRVFLAHPGDPGFEPVLLERDGNFNWRASLPDAWRTAGEVSYFVEAIRTDGVATPIYGSAANPRLLTLQEVKRDAIEEDDRSRATVVFEYVDFFMNGRDDLPDHYWKFESDFRYLVDFYMLRAFSVGVGVFDGSGGSTDPFDNYLDGKTNQAPTVLSRNVSYGSAELEFQFHELFGIAGRLSLGNGRVDDAQTSRLLVAGRISARIGSDDSTRLEFGGNFTEQLGNEGWINLVLQEIDKLPITAGVVATNLPVGKDIGASLNAGIGYQIADWAALSLRTGFNLRNIRHFGLTIGSGLVLNW